MVRPSVLLVALLGVRSIARIECGTKPECDKVCEKKNGIGWECGEYEDGKCYGCKGQRCLGDGEKYKDPKNGKLRCCEHKGEHWTYDEKIKQGLCCAADEKFSVDRKHKQAGCCSTGEPPHHYSYDPEAEEGHCCEEGHYFKGGVCVKKDNDDDDDDDDNNHDEVCGKGICPDDDGDLHLEYGKCYRLKNPEGNALNYISGKDYRWDASDNSAIWQFRVCKDVDNCPDEGTVKEGDEFVLNDVIGGNSDGKNKPWWVCDSLHYKPCTDARNAKKFTATKWCDSENCGICLRGDLTGVGPICPGNRAIGDHKNPNYCTPMRVEKVSCLAPNTVNDKVEHDDL